MVVWADQEIAGENRILPGKNIDALRSHVFPLDSGS